jgi:hypothetical protein
MEERLASTKDARKNTYYLSVGVIEEMLAEARRTGRSMSWMIEYAWRKAYATFRASSGGMLEVGALESEKEPQVATGRNAPAIVAAEELKRALEHGDDARAETLLRLLMRLIDVSSKTGSP